MTGVTLEGRQAYSAAQWAWEDPAGRVGQAISRVHELASSATGAALAECQDVATMLSRLRGAVAAEPAPELSYATGEGSPELISVQLASYQGHHVKGTPFTFRHGYIRIAGQANADLEKVAATANQMIHGKNTGRHAAMHAKVVQEAKNPATISEQAKSPLAASPGKSAFAAARAAAEGHPVYASPAEVPADSVLVSEFKKALDRQDTFPSQLTETQKAARAEAAVASAILDSKHRREMEQMVQRVAAANEALLAHREEVAQHEVWRARKKMAVEASVALGGAVLTAVMAKLGVPDMVAIFAGVGPMIVQVLTEWKKRL